MESGGLRPPREQLETLTGVTVQEMLEALGMERVGWLRPALERLWRPGARRFARRIAAYDELVGRYGLRKGAAWALDGLVGRVDVVGQAGVPAEGPLLVASNHPGLADSLALFANLPRDDLRILATDRPFLTALPHTSRHTIYLASDPRLGAVRQTAEHLRQGGAVLLYPAGEIEPDPAVLPGAVEALRGWSHSVGLLARLAPETRVLPTVVSGVLSPAAQRLPLTRLRRARKDRERLGAMLQVAIPAYQKVTVRVVFGAPLSPEELRARGDSAEAITGVVVHRVQQMLGERVTGV